jgi:hypothetical protein
MFDYRQERFDEIYEAEAQYHAPVHDEFSGPRPIAQPGFQLPTLMWRLMIGCYAIFFGGMAALVAGSGYAQFMVVISVLYVVIFFATSTMLANLSGLRDKSPLDLGQPLPTWCGPMGRGAVYGQVLIVPAGIALFGAAVAIIGMATS